MIIDKIEKMIKEEGIKIKKFGLFDTSLTPVSVIVRSYNEEQFILKALQSIKYNQLYLLDIINLYNRPARTLSGLKSEILLIKNNKDDPPIIKVIVYYIILPFRLLLAELYKGLKWKPSCYWNAYKVYKVIIGNLFKRGEINGII